MVAIERNKEIMRVFRDMELVEQLGSGIPRILKTYGQESFYFSENFTRMSFPIEKQAKIAMGETVGETVGETEQNMLNLLFKQPRITRKEIANELGLSVRGVEYNLAKLKNQGKIRREGATKKGFWKVIK